MLGFTEKREGGINSNSEMFSLLEDLKTDLSEAREIKRKSIFDFTKILGDKKNTQAILDKISEKSLHLQIKIDSKEYTCADITHEIIDNISYDKVFNGKIYLINNKDISFLGRTYLTKPPTIFINKAKFSDYETPNDAFRIALAQELSHALFDVTELQSEVAALQVGGNQFLEKRIYDVFIFLFKKGLGNVSVSQEYEEMFKVYVQCLDNKIITFLSGELEKVGGLYNFITSMNEQKESKEFIKTNIETYCEQSKLDYILIGDEGIETDQKGFIAHIRNIHNIDVYMNNTSRNIYNVAFQ